MQEWVSIYETYECDIGAPDINRFLRVDRLSIGPPGFGVSHAGPARVGPVGPTRSLQARPP